MGNNENENTGERIREIPEDIEWPRYEDGALVDVGDLLRQGMVVGVEMRTEGYHIECLYGSIERPYGERIERPPFSADGVLLEAGDTVWNAVTGEKFKVVDVRGGYVYLGKNGSDHVTLKLRPRAVTHRRPMLDADGVPIHEGDTLYAVKTGRSCKVLKVASNSLDGRVRVEFDAPELDDEERTIVVPARLLTHKRPVLLDADGAPIKDGDTVFMTSNWRRGNVVGFEGEFALVEYDARDVNGSTMTVRTAGGCLTHKPPVRDANGKLIRPGDIVYANATSRGDGTAWRVVRLDPKLAHSVHAEREHGRAVRRDLVPAWLTHEPDTWERIEADAKSIDQLIDSEWGGDPKDARNLVRRCRALAERGE